MSAQLIKPRFIIVCSWCRTDSCRHYRHDFTHVHNTDYCLPPPRIVWDNWCECYWEYVVCDDDERYKPMGYIKEGKYGKKAG